MHILFLRRPVSAFLTAAVALTGFAVPALAAGEKPVTITMPASAFKDDTSRVCMPRTILGRKIEKTLPVTICETRSEWGARGVVFVTK